jgi:hypothetical protein
VVLCFDLIGRADGRRSGPTAREDPRAVPGCEDVAQEKEKRPL